MIRVLLLAVLVFLLARAFWQVVDGMIAVLSGNDSRRKQGRKQPVKLVRDPVCGTYVAPNGARSLTDRSGATHYFCSDECRSKFGKRT
ncbi:MAG TPA: YHS domain-containing protein [Vicinamibacterales bacterium]|nr:YHS domain-containing protein [Vicinamibacterales bacterium]